jgi:uncharacterized protein (DUF1501 family)
MMRLAAAGVSAASSAPWFDALAAHAAEQSAAAAASPAGKRRHKSCILLWMPGGPPQTDTFDMKPDAPGVAGEFKPIATSVPGIQICEHFPKLAKQADKLAILRGMSTGEADHHRATYYMRTGYRQIGGTVHPSLGSIAAAELTEPDCDLPGFVWIGNRVVGSGFLGAARAPFVLAADVTRKVENIRPNAAVDVFDKRAAVLDSLDETFIRDHGGTSGAAAALAADAHRTTYRQALRLMRSAKLDAFDISREPAAVRESYGGTRFGNACLTARRLVEAGVPFVGVCMQADWDTHIDNWDRVRPFLPELDAGWAALLADLSARGMLDDTLVVWMGEFGRDPRINKATKPGREHFARAWTTVLSGAGLKTGQVVGRTGKDGMEVEDRPISTVDFMATVCKALGIDHTKKNTTPDGRPIRVVGEGEKIVTELFA